MSLSETKINNKNSNNISKTDGLITNDESKNFGTETASEIGKNVLSNLTTENEKILTLEEHFKSDENFNDEELKNCSLLDSKSIPTISLNDKAFAHIASDSIIGEVKELEGSDVQITSIILSNLLSGLSKVSTNNEEAKKFELVGVQIAAIAETKLKFDKDGHYKSQATEIAEKVFDLKSGQSYTMPGGWKGFPGHTMLYEFIKNEDGTYDILIFNTGSGAEYHQIKVVENKEKICAIKRYANVTAEELFFAKEKKEIKPALFQKLIECRFLIDHDKSATITAHDIYITFSHLNKRELAVDHSFIEFSTLQRAGTCSYRVLEPYLFYHLTKEIENYEDKIKLYKKTKYQLYLIALINFYRDVEKKIEEKNLNELATSLYLLEQANHKFSRTAAKLFQVDSNGEEKPLSLLSYSEAKGAYATSQAISQKIKEWEKVITEKQKSEELNLSESTEKEKFKYNNGLGRTINLMYKYSKEFTTLNPTDNQTSKIETSLLSTYSCKDPKELNTILSKVVKEFEGSIANSSERTKIRMQIEYLVEQLEIPNPITEKNEKKCFWEEIPKEDLKGVLKSCNKLLRYYFQTTYVPILNLPEQQNCYYALYAFIHKLAARLDDLKEEGPRLKDYGIHFHLTEKNDDAFTTYYDRKSYTRFNSISRYFKEQQQNCIIKKNKTYNPKEFFNLSSLYLDNDEKEIETTSELHYYNELLKLKSIQEYYEKASLNSAINNKNFSNPKMAKIADISTISNLEDKNIFTIFDLEHLLYLKEASAIISLVINCNYHKKFLKNIDNNSFLRSETNNSWGMFNIHYNCFSLTLRLNEEAQASIDMYGIDMNGFGSKEIKDPSPFMDLLWPEKKTKYGFEKREKLVERYEEEGSRLIEPPKSSTPISEEIIKRSSCIPELQPLTLIQEFSKNYDLFSEKIYQQAFEIFLFKHFEKIHPFFSEIQNFLIFDENGIPKEATELQKQCEEFIRKGVQIYYDFQPGLHPKLQPCLFFLRLSILLKNALKGAKIKVDFDERKILQKLLKIDSFDGKELYTIHLHLLASYALEPIEDLSENQIEEITASWLYIQAAEEDSEWQHPWFKNFVTSWFYKTLSPSLAKKFKEDETLRTKSLNRALSLLGISKAESNNWTALKTESEEETDSLCYEQKVGSSGYLKINLLTGSITNENGPILIPKELPYLNDPNYLALFGSKRYPTTMNQGYYYFTTPEFGQIRISEDKEKNEYKSYVSDFFVHIDRQAGNCWYRYLHESTGYLDSLPKALKLKEHSHWISLDKENKVTFEILENGRSYSLAEKGDNKFVEKIILVDQKTGEKKGTLENLDCYPALKETIKNFELPDYTLVISKESGAIELQIPRFISLNGSPLSFEQSSSEKSTFIWGENRNLRLRSIEREIIPGFENILTLANGEGEIKKILIPLIKISATNQFPSKKIDLDLDNPEDSKAQKKRRSYIEIDINKNQLQPQTDEGWLLLAYLSLCQKQYKKSLHYLKKLKATDQLSENSLKILGWILDSHSAVKDKSANGAALRLHAYSILLKTRSRPELSYNKQEILKGKKNEELQEIVNKDLTTYIDGLNNVQSFLHLSKNQELKLLYLLSSGQSFAKSRIHFLEKGDYLKEQKLSSEFLTIGSLECDKEDRYIEDYSLQRKMDNNQEELPFLIMKPTTNFEISFRKLYSMATSGTQLEKNYVQFILDNIQRKEKKEINTLFKYLQYGLLEGKNAPQIEKYSYSYGLLSQLESEIKALADGLKNYYARAKSGNSWDKELLQMNEETYQKSIKGEIQIQNGYEKAYKYCRDLIISGKEAPFFQHNVLNPIFDIQSYIRKNEEKNLSSDKNSSLNEKEILFPLLSSEKEEISKEFEKQLKFVENGENTIQKTVEELEQLSQSLAKDYFLGKSKKETEKREFKIFEKPENERYKSAIKESEKEFQEGYEVGRKENLSSLNYQLAEGKKLEELAKKLKEEAVDLNKPLLKQEETILTLANKESRIKEVALRERLLVEGGTKKLLALSDLIRLFLKGDATAFKEANRHLTGKEIEEIYNEIGNYLLLKSEKQHFERALELIAKIEKSQNKLIQQSLIQKLAETLSSKRTYNPQEYTECLVLESQGNIRIREKQFELIQEMIKTTDEGVYNNLAIQLIMGGGKTSVLASILAILSAKKKRLALFIVPSALFKTVKSNLQKTQLENFGQEVNPIDLERKKFTAENLKWIEKELQKSIRKEKMVLMKPEMIQSLALEFIFLLDQHADSQSKKNEQELEVKIESLRSILNIFRKQSDALGDEIDQLLNTLKAVNFPGGEEVSVEESRINLVKEIYKIATDENEQIEINGELRTLSDFIGLKTNKQTLLSEENYKKYAMPAIAQSLIYYQPIAEILGSDKKLKTSCQRYLCNQIDPKLQEILDGGKVQEELTDQEKQDLAFLIFLHKLSLSNQEKEKEAANLIALSRHILNETLPGTLSKNGNRHYGRKSMTNAKVVPYLGVGSPATTQFADHYRAICFHYQTAISEGISANQILEVAKASTAAALHSAKKLKISFDQTKEAINFKKVTGIELHLIDRPGNLEKAVQYVNESDERVLDLESYTIANEVTFHSKRLNSTPHMFFDQFGAGSSFRGFTGTDWNKTTYPSELEVISDKGSNGKITDLLLERKIPVHQVESDDPAKILEQIIQDHKNPERIRGIIDAGGEFKKYENQKVAEKILEGSKQFEAVVFFGKSKGQSTPDTLFMLKKDSNEPIALQSSQLEDILAKGVALEKIFFYYDERHTTGTDFVQLPDAINLITVGEKSFKRDFDQGAMRLRELFSKQQVEVIVNKESASTFINGGKEIEDIILTTVEKEAIAKADQTVHSFFEQLDNAPKRQALKLLLDREKSVEEISKLYKDNGYQKIFIADVKDEPYKLFGSVRKKIETIKGIKERAEKLIASYKDNNAIVEEIKNLVKKAEQSPFLTKTMMSPIPDDFGQGEEIEICSELNAEQQSDQTKEMQLELELSQELDLYSQKGENKVRQEKVWDSDSILSALKGEFPKDFVKSSINQTFDSGQIKYGAEYGKIFDKDQIFVTENFRLTYEEAVSVFDKAQKPANQILFVKDKEGKTSALLLSYYEAHQFREYLTKLYQENWKKKKEERMEGIDRIWLSGAEGDLFLNNPFAKLNKKEKEIERILFQVNLFNGNVKYLDERESQASSWFKENTELKLRFLKLKVEKDKRAWTILYNSNFLMNI